MSSHSLDSPERDLAQEAREQGWIYVSYEESLQHDPLWVRIAVKTYICWMNFEDWIQGKGWPS
jgi:hypothetical protein